MGQGDFSLTNGEWEVYECLWEAAPLSLTQIARRLSERTGLARSTGETMVARMERKGLLRVEQGKRGRLYSPMISREDAALDETRSFLGRVYGGSLGLMMSSMAEGGEFTKREIDELYDILKRAEAKENG